MAPGLARWRMNACAGSDCFVPGVIPAEMTALSCNSGGSMPITSTSGFDISSDTSCSPLSALPLEPSTLTRRFGPPGAREVGAAGRDLALLDQLIEHLALHDDEVGRLAAVEAPREGAGRPIDDTERVSARAFERWRQLLDRRPHRGGDHGVDLGRSRW